MSPKLGFAFAIGVFLALILGAVIYIDVVNDPASIKPYNHDKLVYKIENPQQYADIKYPADNWDPKLLNYKKGGPKFLSKTFDVALLSPPENDSEEVKAELGVLIQLKEERTDDQIERIKFEHQYGPFHSFIREGLFNYKTHTHTKALLDAIDYDVVYFSIAEKQRMNRARPTQLISGIDPVVAVPKHASYPAGHAAQAYAMALALGMLDPDNKDIYERFALDIGHRRSVAGLHYESDTQGGIALAKIVFSALMEDSRIQELYKAAKTEYSTSQMSVEDVAAPLNIDDVKYPDARWDPVALAQQKRGPKLLSPDFVMDLEGPPLNSSEAVKAEIKKLISLKAKRTDDLVSRIGLEYNANPLDSFVYEGLFDSAAHPFTQMILDVVYPDISYFTVREKLIFKRARPTQLDSNVDSVYEEPLYGSYPSGYAAHSFAIAYVLSELDPKNKDVYEGFARDLTYRREIAGLNYESDISAGIDLSRSVMPALMKTEVVMKLLDEARKEFLQTMNSELN